MFSDPDIYPIVNNPRLLQTEDPFIAILNAKPRSGKTFFMKYILQQMAVNDIISHGWVFCDTTFNGAYDFLPAGKVSEGFDIDKFKKILEYQKQDPSGRPAFIIMDDIVAKIPWKNEIVQSFFMNYRHYNIRVLIATQYPVKIPPTVREQATFYIMFNALTERSLDAIGRIAFADKPLKVVPGIIKKNLHDMKYYCIIADMEEQTYVRFKSPGVNGFRIKKWWTGYNLPKSGKDRKNYINDGVLTKD